MALRRAVAVAERPDAVTVLRYAKDGGDTWPAVILRRRRGGVLVLLPSVALSAADREACMSAGAGLFGPLLEFAVPAADADLEIACYAADLGRGFTN